MIRVTRILAVALVALALMMGCAAPAIAEPVTASEKAANVTAVKFKRAALTLKIGVSYDFNLILSVLPSNAQDRSVTWKTSNAQIATVSDRGVVTILRGGTFRVQAQSVSNPSKKATCTVRAPYVKVKTVSLSAGNVTADKGDSVQIDAKVSPSTATHPQLRWATTDEAVAVVSDSGKVTAKGPGVATITATAHVDGIKAKLKIRVRGGDMKVVKLSAIGDVVLGGDKRRVKAVDDPIGDGRTSYTRFKQLYDEHGAGYFFDKVQGVFQSDDVSIANLESNLTNATGHANKSFVLSGMPQYREILSLGGIDIASVANNHSSDFGQAGHKDTISNVRAAGLKVVDQGANNTATATIDGVRIGFCTFQMPANRTEIQRTIRALKTTGRCKIVVTSFHWTTSKEWIDTVSSAERSMARYAVNCGADLVLGHHKHMVSGIERYKNKMIAYDLGNFLVLIRHVTTSGEYVTKDSMIYQQRFHVFEDGYVEVAAPNIIPVLNSKSLDTLTGQPHVLKGAEAERVLELIRNRTPEASKELVKTISGY